MLFSMTGFVSKSFVIPLANGSKSYLTMNLKSLNARYFEISNKIPFQFQHLETESIKIFKKNLIRGHITFSIQISGQAIFNGTIEASTITAQNYINAINLLQKNCNIPGSITIQDIIQLPTIFTIEEKTLDETVTKNILNAIEQLTQELVLVRKQEGFDLEKDILERRTILNHDIEIINHKAAQLIVQRKNEIDKALVLLDQEPPEFAAIKRNQLSNELDKMDIHEEIVRFKSHIDSLEKIVQSDVIEKGRRIDFILQELSREINTIAAKCSDVSLSSLAINIKVELEKIREQIQNIV